jgi:hypothetical protein
VRRLGFLAVVVLVLAAACARQLLTRFDHRMHLAERPCGGEGQQACLACVSCHQGRAGEHDTFAPPGAAKCSACHEKDGEEKLTHALRPAIAVQPAGKSIQFDHDKHLTLPEVKGQCVKCHAGAVGFEGSSRLFPPMATCTGCHNHQEQFASGVCTNCHRTEDLRGLKPTSFLPHDAAWMRRHGDSARTDGAQCAMCHAQTSCDACHESSRPLRAALANPGKIEREFVHRFDFISRHALESQLAPGQCFTCHVRNECNACHASRGVSPSVRGAQNPHPPGWASGMISNSHGAAARRDIASCAACHDQGAASNCVRCHKVGAMGGTPHMRGFKSTEPITSPSCAPCHGGGM